MARWLVRLALFAATLVVLAVGALMWATTDAGFRRLLGSQGVEIAEGRVSLLGGELEASELRWEGGSAARVALSLDPATLLPGRSPHIRALQVEALKLDLAAPTDGAGGGTDSAFRLPRFVVETAAVSITRLRQLDSEGNVEWQLGPAEFALDAWTPGQQGQLKVRADFGLPSAEPARSGTVELAASLTVPEESDNPLAFTGTLDLNLAPDGLALHAEPKGSIGSAFALSGPLQLSRKGKALVEGGALELNFDAEGNTVALVVKRASASALVAALGNAKPVSGIASLDIGLDARIRLTGDARMTIESFLWEQRRPGAPPVQLGVEGSLRGGPKPEASLAIRGPAADGGEGSATVELAEQVLDLKVASFDLTALLSPWLEDEPTEKEGAKPPKAQPEPQTANTGSDLSTRFEIGALRYRELLVRDARGSLSQVGPDLALDLGAARIGEGQLAGSFKRSLAGGKRTLDWNFDAKELDLTELFRTLDPSSDGQLAGKLDVATQAGASVPEDQDPLDALMGSLSFKLRDAKANDLPFQKFMASKLAVGGLASLAFTGAEGVIPIEKGRALLDDLFIDGNAANFRLSGSLSARDIDLAVSPRLGPRLASDLAPNFANALFETASGALALPVAFRVEGPWAKTEFQMRPAPPSLVGDIVGGTADALKKAASFLFGGGAEEEPAPDAAETTTEAPASAPPAPAGTN